MTKNTRQIKSLSSIKNKTLEKTLLAEYFFYRVFFSLALDKELFVEWLKENSRQIIWYLVKLVFPVVGNALILDAR